MSSLRKNFLYNIVYQILNMFIPLITTPYITRVLGANKIGEYSYAYSIAYYFVLFAMLGLNNYGNRSIAAIRDDREKLGKTFWSIYWMQVMTATISVLIYVLYTLMLANDIISWILLFYVISAVFDINWLFFGLERFKLTVTRNTIIKVISTICILGFVKKTNDLWIYTIIMSLSIFISQVAIWPYVKKYVGFSKVSFKEIFVHFKPNIVLFIPYIAVSLYKTMDKIMLGNMTNMKNVGFYESAEKLINVPMMMVNSLGIIMLPRMSNMYANNDERAESYFYKSLSVAVGLNSLMSFGIMAVSDMFVPWFFGKGFDVCIILIQILLPSCIFLAFANVIRTQYLIPKKRDKDFIISLLLGAVSNLFVNLLLIPKFGAVGAAIGTLIAEIVVCVYQTFSIRKEMNIRKCIMNSIIYIISGVVMYSVLININNLFAYTVINIVIKAFIGLILYLVVLFLLFFLQKKINKIKL